MSVRMMTLVWGLRLETPAKIVLLKLADCADDEGRNAYPSVGRIAKECGMSERTAQRALGRLRLWGLVSIDRPATAMRPITYRVHPEVGDSLAPNRGDSLAPRKTGRGVTTVPSKGCQSVIGGVTKSTRRGVTVTPKPSENRQRNRQKEPSDQTPPVSPPLRGGERIERAKNGSRRKRDVAAFEAEGGNRYFGGRYGQLLKERLEGEA